MMLLTTARTEVRTAVEELAICRVGNDEELPDLGGIGIGGEILVDCKRGIETHLPPVSDAVGPFPGALKRMVGDEAAGKIGLFSADEGVVRMQLKRPLSNLGDLGVVHLDLIGSACR
jgi:hypothetical protein